MRRVIVESPYAASPEQMEAFMKASGDTYGIDLGFSEEQARRCAVQHNLKYLRAAMRHCLLRGEAPFASHGLYTQDGVLRDDVPAERQHGIDAGFAWRKSAHATVVYGDLGISRGMQYGIDHAREMGHEIEYRSLGTSWLRAEAG